MPRGWGSGRPRQALSPPATLPCREAGTAGVLLSSYFKNTAKPSVIGTISRSHLCRVRFERWRGRATAGRPRRTSTAWHRRDGRQGRVRPVRGAAAAPAPWDSRRCVGKAWGGRAHAMWGEGECGPSQLRRAPRPDLPRLRRFSGPQGTAGAQAPGRAPSPPASTLQCRAQSALPTGSEVAGSV